MLLILQKFPNLRALKAVVIGCLVVSVRFLCLPLYLKLQWQFYSLNGFFFFLAQWPASRGSHKKKSKKSTCVFLYLPPKVYLLYFLNILDLVYCFPLFAWASLKSKQSIFFSIMHYKTIYKRLDAIVVDVMWPKTGGTDKCVLLIFAILKCFVTPEVKFPVLSLL